MSEIVKLRTRAEVDEEAAEWTWRMEGESASPADREAFEAWLRQDARHRRAFEEFSNVWRTLDGLGEVKRDQKLTALAERQSPHRWQRRARFSGCAPAPRCRPSRPPSVSSATLR
jgi:ferric-dicitrate binding protein FerR (iron transport regulator)